MATELQKKIVSQVEYYFGDINLPRDKFLKEVLAKNEGGWVPLDVLLSFKRLAQLSTDKQLIADAVVQSGTKLIEVSEDKDKLRRSIDNPLPNLTAEEWNAALVPRSAYAKGFPADESLDNIRDFVGAYGPVDSVYMRHYKDKATNTTKFKGSVTIIFAKEEDCKAFIEAESIKYKEKELHRISQQAFIKEKKAEYEACAEKRRKNHVKAETAKVKTDFPSKTIVKLAGDTIAEKLKWDDIKAAVKAISDLDAARVDFKPGQVNGHLRFPKQNDAEQFMQKLVDGKFSAQELEFTATLATEDEETKYYQDWEQERRNRNKSSGKSKQGKHGRMGMKRKGNAKVTDEPLAKKPAA